MIVAISRIRIISGNAPAVAAQYEQRSRLVEQAPSFLGVEILSGQDDADEFLVIMRWADRPAFEAYRHGPLFQAAHHKVAAISGHTRIDARTYEVGVYDVLGS